MKIVFEKVVPAIGSSFAILDKRAPAFDGRFHFHPEVEITLIESSTGRRVVGDSIEPFASGDLVLLGENLPHQYISDRSNGSNRAKEPPARAKVIQFRADFLGEQWLQLPEFARIAALLLKHSARGLKFSASTTHAATTLIAQLFAASDVRRISSLLDLLDLLARDRGAQSIASTRYLSKINLREGEAIDRALEYLNTNFKDPISLEELSAHLHVSPATCNRLFQKSIGRSFKTALIEIRISHACRLLLETDQSILDVAYASGFTNLSNFNRRFKEMQGHTPREYRNLMRPAGHELALA
jgi:AraC-like DNA-binding protein